MIQQTRLVSLFESVINILIGYGVALASQIVIFPLFDIHVPLTTNLWIGAWFTAISLLRSYMIRRWFNGRLKAATLVLAKQDA
ncbi:MAG: hypothetical protein AB2604_02450 [Candidatus Thiodiazotropha taylori]